MQCESKFSVRRKPSDCGKPPAWRSYQILFPALTFHKLPQNIMAETRRPELDSVHGPDVQPGRAALLFIIHCHRSCRRGHRHLAPDKKPPAEGWPVTGGIVQLAEMKSHRAITVARPTWRRSLTLIRWRAQVTRATRSPSGKCRRHRNMRAEFSIGIQLAKKFPCITRRATRRTRCWRRGSTAAPGFVWAWERRSRCSASCSCKSKGPPPRRNCPVRQNRHPSRCGRMAA